LRRHLARFLVILLLALIGSGTWVSAICECTHGPDVECECPHHQGADPEDPSLPPCHRAAARAAREARAQARSDQAASAPREDRARLKNQCGSRGPAFVQLATAVMPSVQSGPPERVAIATARWHLEATAPSNPEEKIEPPPPRRC